MTKPRGSQNESDYAYVDLPNTNSAEDISFEYSDKSGDGQTEMEEFNHEQEERENYYEDSHNIRLPNFKQDTVVAYKEKRRGFMEIELFR